MNVAQLYQEAARREAEVITERHHWKTVFATLTPDYPMPQSMIAGMRVTGTYKVVPTFLLYPWDNSDGGADPDVMVDWGQEPAARIRWFDEHPNAGRPTGCTIKFEFGD